MECRAVQFCTNMLEHHKLDTIELIKGVRIGAEPIDLREGDRIGKLDIVHAILALAGLP